MLEMSKNAIVKHFYSNLNHNHLINLLHRFL